MNCNHVQKNLQSFFDRTIENKDILAIEQHVNRCDKCKKEYNSYKNLIELLKNSYYPKLEKREWGDLHRSIIDALPATPPHKNIFTPLFYSFSVHSIQFRAVAALLVISFITLSLFIGTQIGKKGRTFSVHDHFYPKIIAVDGNAFSVDISNGATTSQLPIQNELPIAPGRTVRTDNNSSLKILVDKKSTLHLAQNSQCRIADLSRLKTVVKLSKGAISAQVSKRTPDQLFRIETPNAFCEVIGTRFNVTTHRDGFHDRFITTLIVEEGTVKFGSERKHIFLDAGNAVALFGDSLGSPVGSDDPVIQKLLHECDNGHYLITSIPSGAKVTIDGIPSGCTPLSSSTKIGTHSVEVNKSGFRIWSGTIEVSQEKNVTLDIQLSVNSKATERIVYHKPLRHPVFLTAIDYINSGKYNKALVLLRQLIESKSISPITRSAALYKASLCLKNTGKYEEAISLLSKIITNTTYPKNDRSSALFQRATIYKALLHDAKSALSDFALYVNDYPKGIWAEEATYSLAELHTISNAFDKAAPIYQRYCDLYKDGSYREKALYTLGTIYSRHLANYNRARNTFTRLLQDYPNSLYTEDIIFWNADCLLHQGHASRALTEFNKYIQRYPAGKWRTEAAIRLKKIETVEAR